MTEEEAEEINRFLEDRLRSLQEPEIAQQDDLTFRDSDGVIRRYSPKKRLFLTIEALESQMALEDVSTFKAARTHLAALVEGFGDAAVEVVPLPTEGPELAGDSDTFRFETLPDLSDLRARLRGLSERLRSDPETGTDYA